MSEPLLTFRGVKAYYGNVIALKGVDLDVNEGEIVALIGANGAGKSTPMMTVFSDPRAREGSIDDNPLHAELLEIARLARHDFLIDVSLSSDRRIAAVFAGEPVVAHRVGVEWVRASLAQQLEQPAAKSQSAATRRTGARPW